jgi:uncharacterized membrane-anchored protein
MSEVAKGRNERALREQAPPVSLPPESALRRPLSNEVHARPFVKLTAPERVSHLAMLTGEDGATGDYQHLVALCERYGIAPPPAETNHIILDFGDFRLKWERHTEFCSYTFLVNRRIGTDPFASPALAEVPAEWVAAMPGELLVAVNVVVEARDAPERPPDTVPPLLTTDNFAASRVSGGAATAFMDFSIDENGFGRIFVRDHGLKPRQAGRLVQRLLEIETYRMLALTALPLAHKYGRKLSDLGTQLSRIAGSIGEISNLQEERRLLSELTTLWAETERIAAETSYRFSAANAYYQLVQRRIRTLREERVEGFQTFAEFMERRMAPAMSTCEAVRERQDTLSKRVNRTSTLLRTRVDIQLEEQNVGVLHSMDKRAKLQLRLQQTVEGLSVAAISYYTVGLIGYFADGVSAFGVMVPVEIIMGVATPLVAGTAFLAMRRVRKVIERQDAAEAETAKAEAAKAEAGKAAEPRRSPPT